MKSATKLHFRDIVQDDKAAVESFLAQHPTRRLNYCFEVLYLWGVECGFQICFSGGMMLVKTFIDCRHNFLYPLGGGDVAGAVEGMISYAEERGCPFRLFQIPAAGRELLEKSFPGRFTFEADRDEQEYVYSREALGTLAGGKFQHKRNHIHYFEQNYKWSFEPLTPENLGECRGFNLRWFELQRRAGDLGAMLRQEFSVIEKAFDRWETLRLDGAMLRADGEVVAYSMGCPLSGDTYLVLFEKSLHNVRGASQQINRLFVERYAGDFAWVNRGEDGGDEGLRQAKESYHPDILEEIWSAKLR